MTGAGEKTLASIGVNPQHPARFMRMSRRKGALRSSASVSVIRDELKKIGVEIDVAALEATPSASSLRGQVRRDVF